MQSKDTRQRFAVVLGQLSSAGIEEVIDFFLGHLLEAFHCVPELHQMNQLHYEDDQRTSSPEVKGLVVKESQKPQLDHLLHLMKHKAQPN